MLHWLLLRTAGCLLNTLQGDAVRYDDYGPCQKAVPCEQFQHDVSCRAEPFKAHRAGARWNLPRVEQWPPRGDFGASPLKGTSVWGPSARLQLANRGLRDRKGPRSKVARVTFFAKWAIENAMSRRHLEDSLF